MAYNFRFKTGLGSRVHTGRIIYSILYRVENAYKRRHCVYIHEVVCIHRKAIRCVLSSLFSAKNKNKQKQAPESFRGKAVSECASLGSQAQPLAASFHNRRQEERWEEACMGQTQLLAAPSPLARDSNDTELWASTEHPSSTRVLQILT